MPESEGNLTASIRGSPAFAVRVLSLVRDDLDQWIMLLEEHGGALSEENLSGFPAELRTCAGVLLALVEAETSPR